MLHNWWTCRSKIVRVLLYSKERSSWNAGRNRKRIANPVHRGWNRKRYSFPWNASSWLPALRVIKTRCCGCWMSVLISTPPMWTDCLPYIKYTYFWALLLEYSVKMYCAPLIENSKKWGPMSFELWLSQTRALLSYEFADKFEPSEFPAISPVRECTKYH